MFSRPKGNDRLASKGITPSNLLNRALAAIPLSAPPITEATKYAHRAKIGSFDEWLADDYPGGLKVNGSSVNSFKDFIEQNLDFPPDNLIHQFLDYYVKNHKGIQGPMIKASTLKSDWLTFCAAWNRGSISRKVSSIQRDLGTRYCDQLIRLHNLSEQAPEHAYLDKHSVHMMEKTSLDPNLFHHPLSSAIQFIAFSAISVQTGLRPSSIVAPDLHTKDKSKPTASLYTGSIFGCFTMYMQKVVGHPNLACGFIEPRWGKTVDTRGKIWPLVPVVEHISNSSVAMVLILAALYGFVKVKSLRKVFHPSFIPEGEQWEKFTFKDSVKKMHVFQTSNDSPLKTNHVTAWMKELSTVLGFEKTATAYVFRHSVAVHLQLAGEPLEWLKDFLGHAPESAATDDYLLPPDEFEDLQHINGSAQDKASVVARFTRPDLDAPRQISATQKLDVQLTDPIVLAKRKALDETELNEPEATVKIRKLKAQWKGVTKTAENRRLQTMKKDYFAQKRSSEFADSTSHLSVNQVDQECDSEDEDDTHSLERLISQFAYTLFLPPCEIFSTLDALDRLLKHKDFDFRSKVGN